MGHYSQFFITKVDRDSLGPRPDMDRVAEDISSISERDFTWDGYHIRNVDPGGIKWYDFKDHMTVVSRHFPFDYWKVGRLMDTGKITQTLFHNGKIVEDTAAYVSFIRVD